MKKINFLLFLIALFFSHILNAQLNQFLEVEHLPENRLIKKQRTGFIYNQPMDSFAWGYMDKKNKLKVIQTFKSEFHSFIAAEIWTDLRHDTIVFTSRFPYKATIKKMYFSWDGKKIQYLSEEIFDPNDEPLRKADEALSKGNIKEAVEWYSSLQYPSMYINEGEIAGRLLSKANQMAYMANAENKSREAVQYFDDAMNYYYISNLDPEVFSFQYEYDGFLTSTNLQDYNDSIKIWLTNYGYQLYLMGDLKRSIVVNSFLATVYSKHVQPYLVLADSYFEDRQPNEAKTAYIQYIAVMRELGMERYIPSRAFDRGR